MGKAVPDAIYDLMLQEAEGTTIHVTSAEPANYGEIAGLMLAEAAIVGPYVPGPGNPSGRESECPAQTALPITTTGNGDHVVTSDGVAVMKVVTTATPLALTSGGTVDLTAWAFTLLAPT